MRLALKFTVSFLVGMCVVLAAYAYSVARRDIALYRDDMKQDHHVLGCALAVSTQKMWQAAGEEAVLGFIKLVNLSESPNRVKVRWLWVDPPEGMVGRPQPAEGLLPQLRRGQKLTSEDYEGEQPDRFYTLLPVPLADATCGAIEISESLEGIRRYTRATILRLLITTGSVVVVTAGLAVALGIRFVGHPAHALISHARSVAAGRLSNHLRFRQHDELGELAAELNSMTDQLEIAREREAVETAAKIATIEQLRRADRLTTVGRLAAGVAHELGTPLNVVSARAKMIQTGQAAGDEIAANAQIIVEQSGRMTRIIRQLLDFARPPSPRRVWIDLGRIAEHIATLLQPMADKRGVTIQVDQSTAVPQVEVDPSQIEQVLSNLVLNGIQAMPEPGMVTISIETERILPPPDHGGPEDEYIRVSVEDRGTGIADEHLPHLFEPFFTTKQVGEGTGLGLSVSRGIVLEHCGWIAVSSRTGEGTCFSVYLPRGQRDDERRSAGR